MWSRSGLKSKQRFVEDGVPCNCTPTNAFFRSSAPGAKGCSNSPMRNFRGQDLVDGPVEQRNVSESRR